MKTLLTRNVTGNTVSDYISGPVRISLLQVFYYLHRSTTHHARPISSIARQLQWSSLVPFTLRLILAFGEVNSICRKTPWKMSVTRKANQRKRLKAVDRVIEAVQASGVKCAALVCFLLSLSRFFKSNCSVGITGTSPPTTKGT